MNIKDFLKFKDSTDKCSINIVDISLNGGVRINGKKLRKNYRWNLDEFFKSQNKKYPL